MTKTSVFARGLARVRQDILPPSFTAQPVKMITGKPTPLEKIVYKQTRTVNISPESLNKHRIAAGIGNDAIADAYRLLRAQVVRRMHQHGWKSLAITSPAKGQGKTVTAVNLAMTLAKEVTHSVLLIDLDLRSPKIHNILGAKTNGGLSGYLQRDILLEDVLFKPVVHRLSVPPDDKSFEDALFNQGLERLVVLPGGEPVANSSEMLTSPKMRQLLNESRNRYASRWVVLDLPPLLVTDDALACLPYIDAVLLVVRERNTKRTDVIRSLELLEGHNLMGTILNDSLQRHPDYYGYGY